MELPLVAAAVGDPAGIGPEIVRKARADARVGRACRLLPIGPGDVLQAHGLARGPHLPLQDIGPVRPGCPDARTGRASFEAARCGARLALTGLAQALVTAPISKAAWGRAGLPYRDHTQFLREFCGVPRAEMLFVAGPLRAVLATRHVPLSSVPGLLTAKEIEAVAVLAERGLRRLGVRRPRLGLLALNPHAGESGLIGTEEEEVLAPAARSLRRRGLAVLGPWPADDGWRRHADGGADVLVALYHDQALIPLKALRPREIVNFTLGIPFVRTSPGHGTAFDIAGQGRADPEAMIQAVLLAAREARRGGTA